MTSSISRAALFLLLLAPLAGSVKADTIIALDSVGSAADSGQYNSDGATIAIAPNAVWANALPGSSWVSFGLTGNTSIPGFFVVPNGTIVSFFDVFNVPGTPAGGTLTVMADDSATVLLNGVVLVAEATSVGNTYAICSNFGIGCLQPTVLNLPTSLLQSGSNTLEFEVAQRDLSSFGLDYAGSVIGVPESGSGTLLIFGLLMLLPVAFAKRRWNQAVEATASA